MTRWSGPQKTVALTLGVVVLMGSLAWASIPFYNWFCRVTGFAGTTVSATRGSDRILDETVTVRFDGTVDRNLPWQFKPVERQMTLRIGETGLAFFEATNLSDRPIAGTASYNVTPYAAGAYFTKIQCFCFTHQVLEPGETAQMPVTFYVDPDIVNDPEGKFIHTITLSYTFYETELPADRQAGLDSAAKTSVN
jgi:cytochrome c oxidase assembly protein subunit 11